jgi:catechol 2,3-dioxygenase-like lactoylglutathione lyase family enzyme
LSRYVEPSDQLVLEIYVKDLNHSIEFYTRLGFTLDRVESNFAELKWEDSKIYLEQTNDPSLGSSDLAGNIRILVPDVDNCWNAAMKLDVRVVKEIGDRYYGLRDFTIAGPDGVGLRFGTRISRHPES